MWAKKQTGVKKFGLWWRAFLKPGFPANGQKKGRNKKKGDLGAFFAGGDRMFDLFGTPPQNRARAVVPAARPIGRILKKKNGSGDGLGRNSF